MLQQTTAKTLHIKLKGDDMPLPPALPAGFKH